MRLGFRPVLEVLNTDTLGSDGLRVVEIDLNGGKIGGSTDNIKIVVKSGADFLAPTGDGLAAPGGMEFSGWQADGVTYAAGDNIPSSVTSLTAVWEAKEQFNNLAPGETYWFDLSKMSIPGTKNSSLPDGSLHWVPFTYAGTMSAYTLDSPKAITEEEAKNSAYNHSLFIADHALTHSVSWEDLNKNKMIFGTGYTSGGVGYTLRAPSAGSNFGVIPKNNEWDAILDKNDGYIKNWSDMYSWGQDSYSDDTSNRAVRGYISVRHWGNISSGGRGVNVGFRPVLEIPTTMTSDELKVVEIDLNGGSIGGSTDSIQIVVKSNGTFTAPTGDGLTAPEGMVFIGWQADGVTYAAGATVPGNVGTLTAQWIDPPPESTPAISIDYTKEELKGFEDGAGYTINGASVTPGPDGALAVSEDWFGKDLFIVKKGNGSTTLDSATQTLSIPARPAAPAVQGINESVQGQNDGKITGLTAGTDYETSTDSGQSWKDAELTDTEIVDLAPGTYQVRVKSTSNSFAGVMAEVTIATGAERTYTLNVTAPAFDRVYTGYSQPEAEPIKITSSGNSDATISSVTVSGTDFTIGGSGSIVPAGESITTWTIQPAAGLSAGTHTATITVAYDNGATATAEVSFTVTRHSSGGSSSNNKDDGNATIVKRPNADEPNIPTTAQSEKVKADNKGNVIITKPVVTAAIDKAKADAKKHGNQKNGIAVEVPVEIGKKPDGVQITLKADALNKLTAANVKRFTIDTDSMTDFGFTLDTLKELNRQTSGDIVLKVKKTTVTSVEAKAAIGNRTVYDISLWEVKNGKETQITSLNGKTISIAIPYTPAKNEQTGNLYAIYVDGNGKVQWITKSSYDADQKAVIFQLTQPGIYGVGYDAKTPAFTDITNHWAKDNILFVVSRGLFSGTSENTFSPDTGMTRGMFVTALGRLAGINPDSYQTGKFADVKEDAYYAPYVNWAAKTGIVSGTTDTTFAPDSQINREQMAVIMKNYAAKLGYTIPKTLKAVTFADNASISSWAKDSVQSMQQAGILAGKTNNRFDPAGIATRAEVATVLRRFVEIVIDPQTANGWVQNDSGEWSYYKNGEPVKGWLSDNQKWYWLGKNTGKMFSNGWKQIDGKQYYFYADGSMAINTTVDGKTVGADGVRLQ